MAGLGRIGACNDPTADPADSTWIADELARMASRSPLPAPGGDGWARGGSADPTLDTDATACT